MLARRLAVLTLCGVLAWQVVGDGIARQTARLKDPRIMAPFATARHPAVATEMAVQLSAAGHFETAIPIARTAIENAPLNVRALSILGLALEQEGQPQAAAPILRKAASMGWRNTPSLVWALQDAARNENAARVVEIADALARRQAVPAMTRAVFFAALMEPRMLPVLVRRLAERPSWRSIFFADVASGLQPAQFAGMERVLSALAATPAPASADEKLKYVGRLVAVGRYGQARNYWFRAFAIAPPDRSSTPFDGRFVHAAATPANAPKSPFEWQFSPDLLDDTLVFEQQGLSIGRGTSAGMVMASQTMLLAPGPHRLETRLASGSGSTAAAGWTITCLPSNQPLLRTLPKDRSDELASVGFDVPAQGCPAQLLRLTAIERINATPVVIAAVTVR